eukprot:363048-Chlamydomonas_euryale.AAC.6
MGSGVTTGGAVGAGRCAELLVRCHDAAASYGGSDLVQTPQLPAAQPCFLSAPDVLRLLPSALLERLQPPPLLPAGDPAVLSASLLTLPASQWWSPAWAQSLSLRNNSCAASGRAAACCTAASAVTEQQPLLRLWLLLRVPSSRGPLSDAANSVADAMPCASSCAQQPEAAAANVEPTSASVAAVPLLPFAAAMAASAIAAAVLQAPACGCSMPPGHSGCGASASRMRSHDDQRENDVRCAASVHAVSAAGRVGTRACGCMNACAGNGGLLVLHATPRRAPSRYSATALPATSRSCPIVRRNRKLLRMVRDEQWAMCQAAAYRSTSVSINVCRPFCTMPCRRVPV